MRRPGDWFDKVNYDAEAIAHLFAWCVGLLVGVFAGVPLARWLIMWLGYWGF